MTPAFDLLQKRTIQEVLEWYKFQVQILVQEKTRVLADLTSSTVATDSRFFEMTRDEIDEFFNSHQNELDLATMLVLMAAAEAAIRIDFTERVDKRLKDPVSRAFRAINKKLVRKNAADRVSLEEDILDTWVTNNNSTKGPIAAR